MKCSLSIFLLPDFRVTLTANNEKIKQAVPLDWLITSKEDVNGKGTSSSTGKSNLCCHQQKIAIQQNEKFFTEK